MKLHDTIAAIATPPGEGGIGIIRISGENAKEILDNRLNIKFENGKNKMDFVLTYTSNYNSTIIPYVNTGLTESGQHITTIKTLITKTFNTYIYMPTIIKSNYENLFLANAGSSNCSTIPTLYPFLIKVSMYWFTA